MADFEIRLDGIAGTERFLEEVPTVIAAKVVFQALKAGATVIADQVERDCPIKAEDTGGVLDRGELRESLLVDYQIDARGRGGTADIGFGKNGFVALWVEYGHRIVGHRPGKKDTGKRVRPHPFMRPAFDASAERATDAVGESVEQGIAANFEQGQAA